MNGSVSDKWRKQGNDKYKGAQCEGINAGTRRDRMTEAISLYYKAYNTAVDQNEKASASKNLGMANWKMVSLQQETGGKYSQIQYFYKEAISYLDKARHHGAMEKDCDWQADVIEKRMRCMEEALQKYESMSYRERAAHWEQYANCMIDSPYKAECYLEIGLLIFREGINALQRGDYQTTLNDMKECNKPIHEARRLAGEREDLHTEVNVLETDCYLHTCTGESLQARCIGDQLLDDILNQEENLLMTGVYEVIDWYKKAILQARETDVEMEAIAHSRIGVVYDKVIKSKLKAHDYFKKALDLANTLSPRNFGSEEWFQKASQALQKYQEDVVTQETEAWNKNREKYLKEQEKEIKELNTQLKKGLQAFVRFIYKTHPPKKDGQKLEETDGWGRKEIQATLKKAIIHYHPDKQKEYGDKWVVMSEEITKILTKEYEFYKFGD